MYHQMTPEKPYVYKRSITIHCGTALINRITGKKRRKGAEEGAEEEEEAPCADILSGLYRIIDVSSSLFLWVNQIKTTYNKNKQKQRNKTVA